MMDDGYSPHQATAGARRVIAVHRRGRARWCEGCTKHPGACDLLQWARDLLQWARDLLQWARDHLAVRQPATVSR